MIRLTQPELVHDKKQQDSSSPDDSTTAIKKEADAEPVTSQRDQASSGASVSFYPPVFLFIYFLIYLVNCDGTYHKHLTDVFKYTDFYF